MCHLRHGQLSASQRRKLKYLSSGSLNTVRDDSTLSRSSENFDIFYTASASCDAFLLVRLTSTHFRFLGLTILSGAVLLVRTETPRDYQQVS
nr:hypothetical protein CFP56_54869 [Quercus suber]